MVCRLRIQLCFWSLYFKDLLDCSITMEFKEKIITPIEKINILIDKAKSSQLDLSEQISRYLISVLSIFSIQFLNFMKARIEQMRRKT